MAWWRIAQAFVLPLAVLSSVGCGSAQSEAQAVYDVGAPGVATPTGGAYGGMPTREIQALSRDEGGDSDGVPLAEPMPSPRKAKPGDFAKDAPPPTPVAGQPGGGKGPGNQGQQGAGADSARAPILIYTADYTMSVFEVTKSLDAVEALAKSVGGYLARRDDTSITIRIPAEKFQDVISGVEKVGDVTHRNVVSEDVTAEYRDLEVQLANLLALRLRFEKLLEKANKVEEALAIEKELGRITGEIERIKGRLKLLTDLAQYSTITVTFAPRVAQSVQEGPFVLPLPWLGNLGLRRLMSLR
jgi:hypothetical protein